MKQIRAMLLQASIFNTSMAASGQEASSAPSTEVAGSGSGALPDGWIGGPPGVVISPAGVASYGGTHAAEKDDAIAELEKQPQTKSIEPAPPAAGVCRRHAGHVERPSRQYAFGESQAHAGKRDFESCLFDYRVDVPLALETGI